MLLQIWKFQEQVSVRGWTEQIGFCIYLPSYKKVGCDTRSFLMRVFHKKDRNWLPNLCTHCNTGFCIHQPSLLSIWDECFCRVGTLGQGISQSFSPMNCPKPETKQIVQGQIQHFDSSPKTRELDFNNTKQSCTPVRHQIKRI